ncbi:hypothetical protein FOT62_24720 [Serratia marcescens]|uniref:Uncharacterized protein n=1 Tax=Serratia marcescens TaxID=615 RepID=A0A5C7BL83_SERMA|nr:MULTISPECIES: fimbrial protein [Serratia]TXE24470.1 hypothetical protein FOT62_24720 [Serratia marcescens]TXE53306.1 hypothetical protein FOT56_27155 [Serratia marcescens]
MTNTLTPTRPGRGARTALAAIVLLALPVAAPRADVTSAVVYPVTANILVGTCTVSVNPKTLQFEALQSETLKAGVLHQPQAVTLTLACTGRPGAQAKPTLSLEGPTLEGAPDMPPEEGRYLFSQADTAAAQGAGFVLSETKDTAWETAHFYTTSGRQVTPPSTTPSTLTLYAGVGCGTAATCTKHFGGAGASGEVKAVIRFSLAYK